MYSWHWLPTNDASFAATSDDRGNCKLTVNSSKTCARDRGRATLKCRFTMRVNDHSKKPSRPLTTQQRAASVSTPVECAENLPRSPHITRATGERPSQKKRTNEKAGLYVVESPRGESAAFLRKCRARSARNKDAKVSKSFHFEIGQRHALGCPSALLRFITPGEAGAMVLSVRHVSQYVEGLKGSVYAPCVGGG